MTKFQAEMSFDAWRGGKVPPPGGVPTLYIEDRAVPQATKQGAKGARTQLKDNQTSVTDPNDHSTQYWFDDFGRKNHAVSPDTGATQYVYDDAGNLTQQVDAKGTVINYTYDALNRLTSVQFPADPAQNITYTYDSPSVTYGIGRLTGRTDPSGTYVFHYDAQGNMKKEEKTIGGILYTTQYVYNKNNVLSSITYPSGRVVSYGMDAAGRVNQVGATVNSTPTNLASSITYLPFGNITGLIYGNSLSLVQGYDLQYRISSISVSSVLDLTYGYDPNGNVVSIIDAINPPGGEPAEPTGVYSYEQTSNVLTAITGSQSSTFVTDDVGNIISENNRTYAYDLLNRLITVTDNSTQIATYTYNALNQRTKKITGAGTKIFHYDTQGKLIAETNQSGQTLVEYIYLGEQPLAMIRPTEQVYYYHNDHLGTPRVMTNSTGAVAWKALYAPFGKVTITTATIENNPRFPGQYYDIETGLHYNWNRYYDPKTGRYTTPDPIGLEGGINPYPYVENNAVNLMDRWGLDAEIGIRPFYHAPLPYVRHCFIRFNKNNDDTLSFDQKGVHLDPNPKNARFSPTQGKQNDECVKKEMMKCNAEDYDITDFNCCHCASNALNACGLSKVGPWPNKPYDASNPPHIPQNRNLPEIVPPVFW